MATMKCPGCGEPVELGESGVFRHIVHVNGVSSMFHDDTLVHECDVEAALAFQDRDDLRLSPRRETWA